MRFLVACVLTCAAAAAGCSTGPPEITFDTAAATAEPIAIPAGDVPAAQWPNACELLTDDEINAIVPQAQGITREPQLITFLPSIGFQDGQLVGGTSEDLPDGGCEYRFTLPDEYDIEGNSWLIVSVPVISDEANVTEYYEEGKEPTDPGFVDLGPVWDTQGCYQQTTELRCHNGRFYFDLSSGTTVGDDVESVWQEKFLSQVVRTLAAKTR